MLRRFSAFLGICIALASPFHALAQKKIIDSSRLVSIGGSLTEIVYALGEEKRLIGRDSTSKTPKEALALPNVGYMRALSAEGVLSINPSMIIALEGSGPQETIDVLKKTSVPFIIVPETYDSEGIINKIRIVGEVLGVEDRAQTLIKKVEADLKAAIKIAKREEALKKRVIFILSARGGRILASGFGTAADGIISMSGGVNAMDGFSGYKQLGEEAIVKAAPDVILMMSRGGGNGADDAELLANPAIAVTPAGKNRQIIRMSGSGLLGFGPSAAGAIRELSSMLSNAKKDSL